MDGSIARRVDRVAGSQHLEQHVRGDGERVDAAAASTGSASAGRVTFNPVARPGDPDWRVMYLGAGDAQSGDNATAAASTRSGSTPWSARFSASSPTCGSTRRRHGQREPPVPHPQRQSVRDGRPSPDQNVNSQPAASIRIQWRRHPESIAAGSGPTTPLAPPVTAPWHKAPSRPDHDLHPRGAEGQAAAGSHRRPVGSRLDRRRDLRRHQARGPPTMMAGYDGRIPDADIWNIVNYLRTLRPRE